MRSGKLAARAATFIATAAFATGSVRAAGRSYSDLYALSAASSITVSPSGDPEAAATGGQVVSFGVGLSTGNHDQAVVWNPAPGFALDINPVGFTTSIALGTDGGTQVGYGMPSNATANHALLWYGTASSAVDLNPTGYTSSTAHGTSGTLQVGSAAKAGGSAQAFFWRGSAGSAVDLNPVGFTSSVAEGTNGQQEIGNGAGKSTSNYTHALLWNGTARSAVDLNPTAIAGFHNSFGLAVGGSEEVGYGINSSKKDNALLWRGTAASAVNLNPTGFISSVANGTNGAEQVGEGYGATTNDVEHALLWNGTSTSYVDLGAMLPSTFVRSSAFSIDSIGNVFGYAEEPSGTYDAVEWTAPTVANAAPEPAGTAIVVLCGFVLLRRQRRNAS